MLVILISLLVLGLAAAQSCPSSSTFDAKLSAWFQAVEPALTQADRRFNLAAYEYATNVTTINQAISDKAELALNKLLERMRFFLLEGPFSKGDVSELCPRTRRLLEVATVSGTPKNDTTKLALSKVIGSMTAIYATGSVCGLPGYEDQCLQLEGDTSITSIMANSRDAKLLRAAWAGWRAATGPAIGKLYPTYIELENEGARDGGFADAGEFWRSGYDMPAGKPVGVAGDTSTFSGLVATLWRDLQPLYETLHCYVRRKLREEYGEAEVPGRFIPAHLTTNVWAQDWTGLYDFTKPYANATSPDLDKVISKWSVRRIFDTALEFYNSLALPACRRYNGTCVPDAFWTNSNLVKPKRPFLCHASSWDLDRFANGTHDLRIKMCTVSTAESFTTAQHETGHTLYFEAYEDQPYLFRQAAQDGTHEAIGDTILLSALTPSNLKRLGVLRSATSSWQQQINAMYKTALGGVAFLPFGLLIDQYRWQLFANPPKTLAGYQELWWQLRKSIQGVSPPAGDTRANATFFDAGAKNHIPANVPYIRYFNARLLQYQFHEGLAAAANCSSPLHECNIYGSKAAGERFEAMMQLGRSVPWPQAHKEVVGGDGLMSGKSLANYFAPLKKVLDGLNEAANDQCGF